MMVLMLMMMMSMVAMIIKMKVMMMMTSRTWSTMTGGGEKTSRVLENLPSSPGSKEGALAQNH